ncbi:MAG: hypothetical protein ACJ796_14245 [Gemmatimonadaceae bacterium]
MPARPQADQIRQASKRGGLNFSDADINRLASGEQVTLRSEHVSAAGKCSGVKIVDLGNNCGLYVNLFPPTVTVCCEI